MNSIKNIEIDERDIANTIGELMKPAAMALWLAGFIMVFYALAQEQSGRWETSHTAKFGLLGVGAMFAAAILTAFIEHRSGAQVWSDGTRKAARQGFDVILKRKK